MIAALSEGVLIGFVLANVKPTHRPPTKLNLNPLQTIDQADW